MYKLIFADDEEEVRKGILEKIPWKELGFEVIGEAANGIEALEIAEKIVPDIVITDIKMPFMDGIKLCEKIKKRFRTAKVVILTGFDEFEYAQKAIKLSVDEYVLKPISSMELIEILSKMKIKLDEEAIQKKDFETLRDNYKKSLPILKEKFLDSLILNKLSKEDIVLKANAYDIDINFNSFIVSVINMDIKNILSENDSEHSINEKELINFAALNISEEILDKEEKHIMFTNSSYIIIIFCFNDTNKTKYIKKYLYILEQIKNSIEKYIKAIASIGVGMIVSDITNIRLSYEGAVSALDYRFIFGNNKPIYIEDVEPQCTNKLTFDEQKERSLLSALKIGNSHEIESIIHNLFIEISNAKASFKEYNIYLLEMLTAILKAARDLNIDMDKIFGNNYNPFVEIYKFNNLQDVENWVFSISQAIKDSILVERQDSCKMLVEKSTEYINENYGDSELTIDKLCRHLHISPNYFSTIFKKETKQTFVNYLTNIRLEKAKELLKTTSLKTFEIARKVGYSEPNYFSYSFKKNLSISPSEYRNNI